MGLAEITQSRGWQNFMKYVYGWGASVVLIGALFKLTHWPYANELLTVGLIVEALIFFFSAFEPLHEEIDWTLVYPELAGLDDIEGMVSSRKDGTVLPEVTLNALEKFNNMIEKAGDTNIFEKFGEGIQDLNSKVSKMSDISDAALVTNEYAENMKSASASVNSFNDTYKQTGENINTAANNLADSYKQSSESISYSSDSLSDSFTKTSQKISESGEGFNEAYTRLTESMDLDFSSLQEGNSQYNQHIGKLNKNLEALNAIFELQLNEADLDKMMADLQGSVEHSAKYNSEVNKLGKRLEALNSVYGNMLSAMNVNLND